MPDADTTAISDDPLDIIEEEALAVAKCFGVGAPEDAAAMLIERIIARMPCTSVYIPKKRLRDRCLIKRHIRIRFDGTNARALALEYEMSERWVRKIVNG